MGIDYHNSWEGVHHNLPKIGTSLQIDSHSPRSAEGTPEYIQKVSQGALGKGPLFENPPPLLQAALRF